MEGTQQQQPQITGEMVKSSPSLVCDCGNETFREHIMFKRLSRFMTQSGKEEMIPVRIFACTKCGLMPKELDTEGIIPDKFKTTGNPPADATNEEKQ